MPTAITAYNYLRLVRTSDPGSLISETVISNINMNASKILSFEVPYGQGASPQVSQGQEQPFLAGLALKTLTTLVGVLTMLMTDNIG